MAAVNLGAGEALMQKPQTYNSDLTRLPAALLPLTEHDHWVTWVWERRTNKAGKEKWTKPPRQACDPSRNARSNDPSTWGHYEDAVATVRAGHADGIGYMLKDSAVGAIDVDHCIDSNTGALVPWAGRLHQEAIAAYQEVTVSGGGFRIVGKANGSELHRKFTFDRQTGAGIELYRNTARYITISGMQFGEGPAELSLLDELIDRLFVLLGPARVSISMMRARREAPITTI
jgi:primase-polymerase (primpol)-like protein